MKHVLNPLRVISIERGYDPSGFTLVSFGGAGGLHACALAAPADEGTVYGNAYRVIAHVAAVAREEGFRYALIGERPPAEP